MEQVRIHGRGGQGVVTAAELIAIAAFYDGLEAQAFPSFGVERSGAPIQSFARISNEAIITREQIYEPSVLIIQDSSLIETIDVFAGCTKKTTIIINATENKWPHLKNKFPKIYLTPATEIAIKILGKNLVNTVILGAFAKHTNLITLKSLEKAIKQKFNDKPISVITKNLEAIESAYNNISA